ncbi:ATP-binding protein [Aquimarina hainanensis]|uniref:ATP-binding protein n=1 Tax=Aquimarina hainanensis TaxID=1578017 RepID=A0ABW5NDL9_9FLAO
MSTHTSKSIQTRVTTHSGWEYALSFLKEVINYRFQKEFSGSAAGYPIWNPGEHTREPLLSWIADKELPTAEIIVLLIGLVPHVSPGFIHNIISDFFPSGGELPDLGGVKGKNHRGILPTGETIQFLLAGKEIEGRILVSAYFSPDHFFAQEGVLYLETVPAGEPVMSGKIIIEEEFLALLTTNRSYQPKTGKEFPAEKIDTTLEWEDLVLSSKTLTQVKEIEIWLRYHHTLLNEWGMKRSIKPGYRILFSGPPGTGKTLTATLLGKYTKKPVYRIDLSMVVSKYIGETEKNLSRLFDKAKNKSWILFFDEADAIFGKRTNVRDAHDKYANQEVSYLLQRIEAHPGLVILASNFKNNIDTAFTRRFQSIVEFENPGYKERYTLWKKNIPVQVTFESDCSLQEIAKKYEVTGANIVNIIQYVCLKTIAMDKREISLKTMLEGIKKEYLKEGKMISI